MSTSEYLSSPPSPSQSSSLYQHIQHHQQHPPLSDHTQRLGNLVDYVMMQHQKKENEKLHYQTPCFKKESSKQRQRSKSPMRDAISRGQFLD